ncbi:hypothetical protein H100_05557 [Trichophyton rubrum MR850]|nr:hypothetical protein H100_05557 [Trichophyton rubrum MR850]
MPGSPCYITEVNRRPAFPARRFDEPSAQVPMQSRSVVEIKLRGHNPLAKRTRGPAMRPQSHTPCSPCNMNSFPWVLCRPRIRTPGALLFHRSRLVCVSCGGLKNRKNVEGVEDEVGVRGLTLELPKAATQYFTGIICQYYTKMPLSKLQTHHYLSLFRRRPLSSY